MKFWQIDTAASAAASGSAVLRMYGDIGSSWDDLTAEQFARAVDAIEAKQLDVHISSYGGIADAGVAMHHALQRYKQRGGTLHTYNDGFVASAAVAPYLAGDKRFALAGSVLMVHNASTGSWGEAKDLRKQAEALDKISGAVAELYASRTGQTLEAVQQMMDDTTYMTPAEQVELGFATEQDAAAAPVQAQLLGGTEVMMGGARVDVSKLPRMSAATLAYMLGSGRPAAAPAMNVQRAAAGGNTEGEGPTMDLAKLKAEHADVFAAAMKEGAAEAVQAERARIVAIQQATVSGFEADAESFIQSGGTAADYALAVLKKQKEAGTTYLNQRQEDAADGANKVAGDDGHTDDSRAQADADAFLQMAAAGMKKTAGIKS